MTPQGGSQGDKYPRLILLPATKCLPVSLIPAPFRSQRARESVHVVHKSQVSGTRDKVRKAGVDVVGKSPFEDNFSFSSCSSLLTSKELPRSEVLQEMS